MALSTQPYRGARDFYPDDKRLQKYMFSTWRMVVERFGYEEYDAPILEPLDIYLAKTGEEIVNEQTYSFTDRGGRQVVLRPEMTPTVSRMVAGKRQELSYPLRWYSIPNLWRYERPQRGRLREHWQLNVDLFGVSGVNAEAEMLKLVDSIFKAFGADSSMYQIRLNHRALIDHLLSHYVNLSAKSKSGVAKLIDRMHKMDRSKFITSIDEVLTSSEKQAGATEKLLSVLSARKLADLPISVQAEQSYKELEEVISKLTKHGLSNVSYDPTIMRGFDYYTGIVFEVFDTDPSNNRSMMGGGRYDALVGLFGVKPVATVGFGWGDVTLANFLEVHSLLPKLRTETQVYLITIGDNVAGAESLAKELRERGVNVAEAFSNKKVGDQIKVATKKGIDYVLIVGSDEVKLGKYKLKLLETGQESTLSLKQIIDKLNETSK